MKLILTQEVTGLGGGVSVLGGGLGELSNADVVRARAGRDVSAAGAPTDTAKEDVRLEVRDLAAGRVRDVSFTVRSGEIVGFAGLLGAGRSRTLQAVFGAAPRVSGQVRLASSASPVEVRTIGEALRGGMGFVPEDRRGQGLILDQSVRTNVTLVLPKDGARYRFLRFPALDATAAEAIRALAIKTAGALARVRTLSGGNQQKVVLGRFMRPETRVLLLDEPTRGVDVAAKEEIHRHLEGMAARGLSLVVASSEIPELLRLCHRILVFREGRIVGELLRAEATAEKIVALAAGVAA